jgi:hypothetical protein
MKTEKLEILSISEEIQRLEARKVKLVDGVIANCKKSIPSWAASMDINEFKKSIQHLFTETANKRGGTDYFTWGKTENINLSFQDFVKKALKDKEATYFHDPRANRFFKLKRFHMRCTSRSSAEMEYYTVNKQGHLVYNYSGTAYHGFGSVDDSVQQVLVIDLDKMVVTDYTDSKRQYHSRSSGIHRLDTDFIDKLVK